MSNTTEIRQSGFKDLSNTACSAVYIANSFLIIGWIVLFVISFSILIGAAIFAVLPEALNNGNFIPLIIELIVFVWFLAGFACFVATIFIAAKKRKWSWKLQFTPFISAAFLYALFVILINIFHA